MAMFNPVGAASVVRESLRAGVCCALQKSTQRLLASNFMKAFASSSKKRPVSPELAKVIDEHLNPVVKRIAGQAMSPNLTAHDRLLFMQGAISAGVKEVLSGLHQAGKAAPSDGATQNGVAAADQALKKEVLVQYLSKTNEMSPEVARPVADALHRSGANLNTVFSFLKEGKFEELRDYLKKVGSANTPSAEGGAPVSDGPKKEGHDDWMNQGIFKQIGKIIDKDGNVDHAALTAAGSKLFSAFGAAAGVVFNLVMMAGQFGVVMSGVKIAASANNAISKQSLDMFQGAISSVSGKG